MSEAKKTRKSLTTEERLEKVQQQKIAAYKSIIKEIMGKSPKFIDMKDAYLKNNKWLHEAKLIVASQEECLAAINKQLDALNAKHKIATEAITTLQNSADSYTTVMQKLGEELSKVMSDPATTPEELTAKAEELLAKHIADFKSVSDPFQQFRKKD